MTAENAGYPWLCIFCIMCITQILCNRLSINNLQTFSDQKSFAHYACMGCAPESLQTLDQTLQELKRRST